MINFISKVINELGSEKKFEKLLNFLSTTKKIQFQINMCLVAQVSGITSHRIAINPGFNINYNLPFRPREFYSPMFWARKLSKETSPMINFIEKLVEAGDFEDDDQIAERERLEKEFEEKEEEEEEEEEASDDQYDNGTESADEMTTTELYMQSVKRRKPKARRDLTAGQFYSGLKELMS